MGLCVAKVTRHPNGKSKQLMDPPLYVVAFALLLYYRSKAAQQHNSLTNWLREEVDWEEEGERIDGQDEKETEMNEKEASILSARRLRIHKPITMATTKLQNHLQHTTDGYSVALLVLSWPAPVERLLLLLDEENGEGATQMGSAVNGLQLLLVRATIW
jgi:hypothetical protein